MDDMAGQQAQSQHCAPCSSGCLLRELSGSGPSLGLREFMATTHTPYKPVKVFEPELHKVHKFYMLTISRAGRRHWRAGQGRAGRDFEHDVFSSTFNFGITLSVWHKKENTTSSKWYRGVAPSGGRKWSITSHFAGRWSGREAGR